MGSNNKRIVKITSHEKILFFEYSYSQALRSVLSSLHVRIATLGVSGKHTLLMIGSIPMVSQILI